METWPLFSIKQSRMDLANHSWNVKACKSHRHGLKAATKQSQIFQKDLREMAGWGGSGMTGGPCSACLARTPTPTSDRTSGTLWPKLCRAWRWHFAPYRGDQLDYILALRGALKSSVCQTRTQCPSSQFRMYFQACGWSLHFLKICNLISGICVMVHVSGPDTSDSVFLSCYLKIFPPRTLKIKSPFFSLPLSLPPICHLYRYILISQKSLTGIFYDPWLPR